MSNEVIQYKNRIRNKLYHDEILNHFRYKKDLFMEKQMKKTSFKKVLYLFNSKHSFYMTNIFVNVLSLISVFFIWGQISATYEHDFVLNAAAFFTIMSLFSVGWTHNPLTKYIYRFIYARDIDIEKEKLLTAEYKNQKLEPDDIDILAAHLDRDEMRFFLLYYKDYLNYRTIDIDQLEYEKSEIIREIESKEKLEELLDSMYEKPLNKKNK